MRNLLTMERLDDRHMLAVSSSLLQDFTPGEASSEFSEFKPTDQFLYFKVGDTALWRTDGTQENTTLLDANADYELYFDPKPIHGGLTVFNARWHDDEGVGHTDVWVTDGTEDGTKLLIADRTLDQDPIIDSDGSSYLMLQNYRTSSRSAELWRVVEDSNATLLVEVPDAGHHDFQSRQIGGITYLNTIEDWGGVLIRTDGTSDGSRIVTDSLYGDLQQNSNGWHYLEANEQQTSSITQIDPESGDPENLINFDWATAAGWDAFRAFGELFFITRRGNREVACISDGTHVGTRCDLFGSVAVDRFYNIQELNGVLLLPNSNGLWRTDGTREGTYKLADGAFNYLGRTEHFAYIGSPTAAPYKQTIVEYTDGFEVFDAVVSNPLQGDGSEFLPPTPELDQSGFGSLPGAYWTFSDEFSYRHCYWESHCGRSELWVPTETGTLQQIWHGVGRPLKIENAWFRSNYSSYIAKPSGEPIVETFSVGWQQERMQVHSNRASTDLPVYFTTSTEQRAHLWAMDGDANVNWIGNVPDRYYVARNAYEDILLFVSEDDLGGTQLWASEVGSTRTQLVAFAEGDSPNPSFVRWNGANLVIAETPETGRELWVVDGKFNDSSHELELPVISVVDVGDDAPAFQIEATWPQGIADTYSYSWDLNDDGIYGDAEGRDPTLTWQDLAKLDPIPRKDTHNPISVRVVDDSGNEVTSTGMMRVRNTDPEIHSVQLVSESKVGETIFLTTDASDLVGDPLSFDIDFGDGRMVTTQDATVSHAYDRMGAFTVTVTVNDPHGGTTTAERIVKVDHVDPQLRWQFEPGSVFGGSELAVDIDFPDVDGNGKPDNLVVTVDGASDQRWQLDQGPLRIRLWP